MTINDKSSQNRCPLRQLLSLLNQLLSRHATSVLSSWPGLRQLRRLAPAQLPESPSGFPQAQQCPPAAAELSFVVIHQLHLIISATRSPVAAQSGHWVHAEKRF
jgi:hypothetical protein